MQHPKKIASVIRPQLVSEGAGVKLQRSIATRTLNYLDPFLLLDHFDSNRPEDYLAGFPMHPHRGIETVTYVLDGSVHHQDSLGNAGTIGKGDIQWMTAGGGILHEEMPQRSDRMNGFQLWVNLPAKQKMMHPRYQDVPSKAIPQVQRNDGSLIRVVAGNVDGTPGAVTDIAADPLYLDVTVPPQSKFTYPIPAGHNSFSYIFEGSGSFGEEGSNVTAPTLIVWGDGDFIEVTTKDSLVRFLLVSGKPLNEPVARYGPFVMNTKEEIEQALDDLRRGTFVSS